VIAPRQVAVIVRATAPARVAEALRAALGLTLRGDRVRVVLGGPPPPEGARAAATLAAFGYPLDGPDALAEVVRAADAIEVWT